MTRVSEGINLLWLICNPDLAREISKTDKTDVFLKVILHIYKNVNVEHEGIMTMLFHNVSYNVTAFLKKSGSEMKSEQHSSV